MSRHLVLVHNFDRKAIRRRMYQLYEAKKDKTLSKLLVTRLRVKTSVSSIIESYNGAWNLFLFLMYVYSAWLLFVLLLCFMFLLTQKSIACNHRRLYYVSSEVPAEIIHQNAGRCYRS